MKSGTKRPSETSGSLAGRQDDCQDVRPSVVKTSSGGKPDQSDKQTPASLRTLDPRSARILKKRDLFFDSVEI